MVYKQTDEMVNLCVDNRTITSPTDLNQIFIEGEHNSRRIHFTLKRYFDGFDLSTKQLKVVYQTPEHHTGESLVTDLKVEADALTFQWIPSSKALSKAGILYICLVSQEVTPSGEVKYIWKTKPFPFSIEPQLQSEGDAKPADYFYQKAFLSSGKKPSQIASKMISSSPVIPIEGRNIVMPQLEDITVSKDTLSRIITFQINRYYDNIDLSEKHISIKFLNANKEGGRSFASNEEVSDTHIQFSWLIDARVTKYPGEVSFAIEFLGFEGTSFYCLQTLQSHFTIPDSLSVDDLIPLPSSHFLQNWNIIADEYLKKYKKYLDESKKYLYLMEQGGKAAKENAAKAEEYAKNAAYYYNLVKDSKNEILSYIKLAESLYSNIKISENNALKSAADAKKSETNAKISEENVASMIKDFEAGSGNNGGSTAPACSHNNLAVLNKLEEDAGGNLLYNKSPLGKNYDADIISIYNQINSISNQPPGKSSFKDLLDVDKSKLIPNGILMMDNSAANVTFLDYNIIKKKSLKRITDKKGQAFLDVESVSFPHLIGSKLADGTLSLAEEKGFSTDLADMPSTIQDQCILVSNASKQQYELVPLKDALESKENHSALIEESVWEISTDQTHYEYTLSHPLNSEKLIVSFYDKDNNYLSLSYSILSKNKLLILSDLKQAITVIINCSQGSGQADSSSGVKTSDFIDDVKKRKDRTYSSSKLEETLSDYALKANVYTKEACNSLYSEKALEHKHWNINVLNGLTMDNLGNLYFNTKQLLMDIKPNVCKYEWKNKSFAALTSLVEIRSIFASKNMKMISALDFTIQNNSKDSLLQMLIEENGILLMDTKLEAETVQKYSLGISPDTTIKVCGNFTAHLYINSY